jgi:hypothetical protein
MSLSKVQCISLGLRVADAVVESMWLVMKYVSRQQGRIQKNRKIFFFCILDGPTMLVILGWIFLPVYISAGVSSSRFLIIFDNIERHEVPAQSLITLIAS